MVKAYTKNGNRYTESSPGSNKFQNFTTVTAVREASRAEKAKVVSTGTVKKSAPVKMSIPKPGESKVSSAKDTRPVKSKPPEKRYPSKEDRASDFIGQTERYRPAPVTKGVTGSDAKGKRGVGTRINYYFGYPAGTRTIK